jgi:hypothetical protein
MDTRKYGEVRADGYRFHGVHGNDGAEQWYSPASWHRMRVTQALGNAKRRAAEKGLPCELTRDYLLSIFPADGLCPALGIPLVWGGNSSNSPALDRRDNALGYVPGNVQWLSHRANTIKSDATTAEICAVAEFLRKNDY